MTYKAAVITISDKGARGERIDTSGPGLVDILKDSYEIIKTEIIPDEKDIIAETINRLVDE